MTLDKQPSVLMVVGNAGMPTEQFIWNEVLHLREHLDDLTILSDRVVGNPPDFIRRYLVECAKVPIGKPAVLSALPKLLVKAVGSVKLRCFARGVLSDFRQGLVELFKVVPLLEELDREYDIVHVQFASHLPYVKRLRDAGILRARRIVCSVRGHDISDEIHRKNLARYIDEVGDVDMFLPVSELFQRELIELGVPAENVSVKYSPVNLDLLREVEATEALPVSEQVGQVRIVSCGRLVDGKGFDTLLHAVAALRDTCELSVEIIGEGPLENELIGLSETLGLASIVQFCGLLPHREALQKIRSADYFVLCSKLSSTGVREGIPNVLKEAMALGTLVIASDHSGIPELVEDGQTGFLFPEDSPERLAKVIASTIALTDAQQVPLKNAAREHIYEAFELSALGARQLGIYQELR